MTIVLDASVTLALYFHDERTPVIETLFARIAADGAITPTIWPLEVANGLQMAIRRGRVDATAPVSESRATGNAARSRSETIPDLADRHRLTIYDAAYLELALRKRAALASLDKKLRAAGAAVGLQLLGA